MGRNRLVGGPYQPKVITESVVTDPTVDLYLVSASVGSPVTVTLDPAAVQGDRVAIQDGADNATSQAITIEASPGQTILGGLTSLSINVDGAGFQLTFNEETGIWTPQALSATGTAAAAEIDHLIDHVDTSAVESAGSGAVVTIGSDNAVILAIAPAGEFSYGVYEGVPGIIRTVGIVPDLQMDPASPTPNPADPLYVSGATAGLASTHPQNIEQPAFGEVVDASMFSVSNRRVKAYVVPPQNPIGSGPPPPPPPG